MVIGRQPKSDIAELGAYACYAVKGEPYPALIPEEGAIVPGLIYEGISPENLRCLDAYEGADYTRRRVSVKDRFGRELTAWTYIWKRQYRFRLASCGWDIKAFERRYLPHYRKAVRGSRAGGANGKPV